jgi:hypothetical protein
VTRLRLAGLGRLGGALERSVAHFNATVGAFESRVLPQARRLS